MDLQYEVSQHDDGESFTIHSEGKGIWEKKSALQDQETKKPTAREPKASHKPKKQKKKAR